MSSKQMEAWLKILAICGAGAAAVLSIICCALWILLGTSALAGWALIFALLGLALVAVVAVFS